LPEWFDGPNLKIFKEHMLHISTLSSVRRFFNPPQPNPYPDLGYKSSACIFAYIVGNEDRRNDLRVIQSLLRRIRREADLHQVDLAERLGKPQSYVSKYESGERRLDLSEVRRICAAVGITLTSFTDRLEKELDEAK
jgi:hypothetical protein